MGPRPVCALGALLLVGGCCGYGGPGCGEPYLVGICAGQVAVGASAATVSFGDDTGSHPSEYGWVEAAPEDVLRASRGGALGEVVLEGIEPGEARIRVGAVEGWDDELTFDYSVKVVGEIVEAACAEEEPTLISDRERAGAGGN